MQIDWILVTRSLTIVGALLAVLTIGAMSYGALNARVHENIADIVRVETEVLSRLDIIYNILIEQK